MNTKLKILIPAFLFVCLLPHLVVGQSLKERITECYNLLIDNQDLTLSIDVKAWKRGRKDRPLDQAKFIYINDQEGFYMKTLDIEVVQNKDLTVRVDHGLQEVSVIPSPDQKPRSPEDLGLPTWLMHMNNMDSVYTIQIEKQNEAEVYTLMQGDYKAMVVSLQGNKITRLIQYPPQQVEYRGKSITTVVEMNYTYQPARARLRLDEVIDKHSNEIRLKDQYEKYKIIDYRDLEK